MGASLGLIQFSSWRTRNLQATTLISHLPKSGRAKEQRVQCVNHRVRVPQAWEGHGEGGGQGKEEQEYEQEGEGPDGWTFTGLHQHSLVRVSEYGATFDPVWKEGQQTEQTEQSEERGVGRLHGMGQ